MPEAPAPRAPRCLVFGGSGALGRTVVETLAGQGARVAFTFLTGEGVAADLKKRFPDTLPARLDLSSRRDVERVIDEAAAALGGIDAFVQCAVMGEPMECRGDLSRHRMLNVDEDRWDRIFAVNVKGTYFACRRLIEVLRRGGGGNLVLIGSLENVKPVHAPVHYAATKGALGAMVMAMAKELGEYGIKVNLVAPGLLEAGVSAQVPDYLIKEYVKHCGLRRVGRCAEVAGVIAWLSLQNTYVTGQTILVDGAL